MIRDPLYGYIVFPRDSVADRIVNSREFQRLRMIKQLGMASYVFPSAEHNRFSHSIGCYYLARYFDSILGHEDNEKLYLAALLHDVGHPPLSHVLEGLFPKNHEEMAELIIGNRETEINSVLESSDISSKSVSMIITRPTEPIFWHSMISSQLDVDRFDFLRRDSHFTGNPCGQFDIDRVLRTIVEKDGRLKVLRKGVPSVEDYLYSRYSMYTQVYLHKTKLCCERMLRKALERAQSLLRSGDIQPESILERFLNSGDISVSDYLRLTDNDVFSHITKWSSGADPILRDMTSRLLRRNLLKPLQISGLDTRQENVKLLRLVDQKEKIVKYLEKCGFDPDYYFILHESSAISPYVPYSEDKEGESAIFTEDDEEISNYLQELKIKSSYNIVYIMIPEQCREKVSKLLEGTN